MINHQELHNAIQSLPELHTGSIKNQIEQNLRYLAGNLRKEVHIYENDLTDTKTFLDTLDETSDKYSLAVMPIRIEEDPVSLVFTYNKDQKCVRLDHEYRKDDPIDAMICLSHRRYFDQDDFREKAEEALSGNGAVISSIAFSVPSLNTKRMTVSLGTSDPENVYFILNPFEDKVLQIENIQIDIPQPSDC